MKHAAISRVYATALIELALEKGELTSLISDLKSMREFMAVGTGFTRAFESPELGFDEKRRLLTRVTEGAESSLTLRFLLLLVRKHREPLLGPILAMFDHLLDEREGRLRGRLMISRELAAGELAEIERVLSGATDRSVSLDVETDRDLLAGMVLHLADKTVDGSLKSKLSRLREHLLTAEMGKG